MCKRNHHGTVKLGLARLLQEFANEQWFGEHFTEEQAVTEHTVAITAIATSSCNLDS